MARFQLSISNLSKNYGSRNILESISVNYSSGLIHGIIGANGSGKTTFFNCITRNSPSKGNISYPENLQMGYLPTELFMYPRISGTEFIQFCLSSKKIPFIKNEVNNLNQLFELPLDEYAETYSTGMLKKLYLLVLILEKNDILVLDEPFNGLDVNAVSYISELIKRLKEQGTLILISSHIILHLSSISDTLSFLENGKLQFIDNKSEFGELEKYIENKNLEKFKILQAISKAQRT